MEARCLPDTPTPFPPYSVAPPPYSGRTRVARRSTALRSPRNMPRDCHRCLHCHCGVTHRRTPTSSCGEWFAPPYSAISRRTLCPGRRARVARRSTAPRSPRNMPRDCHRCLHCHRGVTHQRTPTSSWGEWFAPPILRHIPSHLVPRPRSPQNTPRTALTTEYAPHRAHRGICRATATGAFIATATRALSCPHSGECCVPMFRHIPSHLVPRPAHTRGAPRLRTALTAEYAPGLPDSARVPLWQVPHSWLRLPA